MLSNRNDNQLCSDCFFCFVFLHYENTVVSINRNEREAAHRLARNDVSLTEKVHVRTFITKYKPVCLCAIVLVPMEIKRKRILNLEAAADQSATNE